MVVAATTRGAAGGLQSSVFPGPFEGHQVDRAEIDSPGPRGIMQPYQLTRIPRYPRKHATIQVCDAAIQGIPGGPSIKLNQRPPEADTKIASLTELCAQCGMVPSSLGRFLAGCQARVAGTDQHRNFPAGELDVAFAGVPGLRGSGEGWPRPLPRPRPRTIIDLRMFRSRQREVSLEHRRCNLQLTAR
jgi:hypothetical protein